MDELANPADDGDEILELSDEEFAALDAQDQQLYLQLLQERVDRWELFPKQRLAHERSDEVDELLFGGAAGPGKTETLVYHVYDLSRRFDGHHSLLIRRTHPNLRRSLIRRCHQRFDPTICTWRAADKEYRFANGSIIEFGYCDSEDDVYQYLSAEYDFIGFEEATELSGDQLAMIGTRCRTTTEKRRRGINPHIWYTTNPGGPGHAYLKRRFVEPTDYGRIPVVEEPVVDERGEPLLDPQTNEPLPPRKVSFIHTTVRDNPEIDPGYLATLNNLNDPVKRRMYLYGDWDVFAGQFFPEFDRQYHVVDINPADIPKSWPRWCAVDYGHSAPWCSLWFTADPDGNVLVYRQVYKAGVLTRQQARDWKAMSGSERIGDVFADPAVFKDGLGQSMSTASAWAEEGMKVRRARNDRVAGWARVREFLALETPPPCPECGGDGCDACEQLGVVRLRPAWAGSPTAPAPGVYVASSCVALVDELIGAQYDKTKTEDLDTKLEWKIGDEKRGDHALDALRYGLMTRPPRHRHPVIEDVGHRVMKGIDLLRSRRARKDRGYDDGPSPSDLT